MGKTSIEWADYTFNPWIGCTKVSPGCANCYAEARDKRFYPQGECGEAFHWGSGHPRQRTGAANWKLPLKWNKEAEGRVACACGFNERYVTFPGTCPKCKEAGTVYSVRPRVFCGSLCDWLDDEVPIEWLADLLVLIHSAPNLDWLLLSKRPENWTRRINAANNALLERWLKHPNIEVGNCSVWLTRWTHGRRNDAFGRPPTNVWIGATVENQEMADKRIPELLEIPAKLRFLSCEPLLGEVDLPVFANPTGGSIGIDWVVCGGESGKGARPMHPDWVRSLRDQCEAAEVPFFFKQMDGKHKELKDFPEDLRIRSFPKEVSTK